MAILFDDDSLLPASALQFDTCKTPMIVWMNRDAVAAKLGTGTVRCWAHSWGNPVVIAEADADPKDLRN